MTKRTEWDDVDQASFDSFPASDPPSSGGLVAAASASTACPPGTAPGRAPSTWVKRIAVGLAAATAITGLVIGVRLLRSR
jgi:hypothetical protein